MCLVYESVVRAVGFSEVQNLDGQLLSVRSVLPEPGYYTKQVLHAVVHALLDVDFQWCFLASSTPILKW